MNQRTQYRVEAYDKNRENSWCEYKGTDLNKAVAVAQNEIFKNNRSKQDYWIELQEIVGGYHDDGTYDYNVIDYPHFSILTDSEITNLIDTGECQYEPMKTCYFIDIQHGETRIYHEIPAEEYYPQVFVDLVIDHSKMQLEAIKKYGNDIPADVLEELEAKQQAMDDYDLDYWESREDIEDAMLRLVRKDIENMKPESGEKLVELDAKHARERYDAGLMIGWYNPTTGEMASTSMEMSGGMPFDYWINRIEKDWGICQFDQPDEMSLEKDHEIELE